MSDGHAVALEHGASVGSGRTRDERRLRRAARVDGHHNRTSVDDDGFMIGRTRAAATARRTRVYVSETQSKRLKIPDQQS